MSRKEVCVNELFSRYETSFQSLVVRAVAKWKGCLTTVLA